MALTTRPCMESGVTWYGPHWSTLLSKTMLICCALLCRYVYEVCAEPTLVPPVSWLLSKSWLSQSWLWLACGSMKMAPCKDMAFKKRIKPGIKKFSSYLYAQIYFTFDFMVIDERHQNTHFETWNFHFIRSIIFVSLHTQ